VALVVIVIAEFLGTSLWFSANGVADRLALDWGLTPVELGYLTSSVQLGFIAGTLVFAVSGLADRYPASRIFLISALIGAVANAGFALWANSVAVGAVFRFITGVTLAGIYPVGMKLVVSWAPERRGAALGWLVGMLVLGTAFPHLVHGIGAALDWHTVVLVSSVLAVGAGVAVARMGDGPHHPRSGELSWGAVFRAFRVPGFRAAAMGYFGHMWELYAVWTVAPLLIARALAEAGWGTSAVAVLSFGFIAMGGVGCVLGGWLSRHVGSARVAFVALAISGALCVAYPWLDGTPLWVTLSAMAVWGLAVAADSPQFSALAAAEAPVESLGSALAIMNSIGFLITVLAIQLVTSNWQELGPTVAWLLAPGPVLGLWSMRRMVVGQPATV
jgi:MFS family permease